MLYLKFQDSYSLRSGNAIIRVPGLFSSEAACYCPLSMALWVPLKPGGNLLSLSAPRKPGLWFRSVCPAQRAGTARLGAPVVSSL